MFARPLPSLLPAETYATLASLILGFEVRQLADLATWPAPSCGNCCSRHHGNLVNPWNSKGFQTPDRRFPDTRNPACRRFPDTQGFQTPKVSRHPRFPDTRNPACRRFPEVSRFPDTHNPACRRHAPSSAPRAVNGRPLPVSPHPARGWFAFPPSRGCLECSAWVSGILHGLGWDLF
jgi:hypothetical protein